MDEPAAERAATGGGAGPEAEGATFECRVGHRYTGGDLADEQLSRAEASVWAALSTMEERAALLRREAMRAEDRGLDQVAAWHRDQAMDALRHAGALRETVLGLVQSQRKGDSEQRAA